MTKTERLIDRIKKVEKFYDVAFYAKTFKHSLMKFKNGELTTYAELTLTIQT